jgi:desumoylating isopeptidase 1
MTHHGRPMEVVPMGRTDLPLELILEYVDGLRSVYSAEVGRHENSSQGT